MSKTKTIEQLKNTLAALREAKSIEDVANCAKDLERGIGELRRLFGECAKERDDLGASAANLRALVANKEAEFAALMRKNAELKQTCDMQMKYFDAMHVAATDVVIRQLETDIVQKAEKLRNQFIAACGNDFHAFGESIMNAFMIAMETQIKFTDLRINEWSGKTNITIGYLENTIKALVVQKGFTELTLDVDQLSECTLELGFGEDNKVCLRKKK